MTLDPSTPVLIGYGQISQLEENPGVEPVDLMAAACRRAAPARVLEKVDSVLVVNLLSWRYRDPGRLLAQRLGAPDASSWYSGVGGNVPQALINQACRAIGQGRSKVALIAGAETWRTRTRLRSRGIRPDWTAEDASVPRAPVATEAVPMVADADARIGLDRPVWVYPMFEQALRIAAGESIETHRRRIGELWARFSEIAEANPHAFVQRAHSAVEICEPSGSNRLVSWPYTKLMTSNNMVDQGAAVVVASAQMAADLQIPRDQWIFPHASAEAHDSHAIGQRGDYSRSPAIRAAGRRVLELADTGIDEIGFVDLYSCFPSAVQVAAAELGLPTDDAVRPLTVTGGLTFAGGPWNNYVTHSIATMAEKLMSNPGSRGLVTANGGYLTKHAVAVYGTQPSTHGFRWEDVQHRVDPPDVRSVTEWSGVGTVETWTTVFDRDQNAEKAFLAVRTSDGARTLAVIDDASGAASIGSADIAGWRVSVRADGCAELL